MIDLTSGIDLSSSKIENTLNKCTPIFLNVKDNVVELGTRLPNMMNTLWGFVCTYKYFPTQVQFVSHYLCVHHDFIKSMNTEAVKARLLRSYPSLTREIHFYSLTKESNMFDSVQYNMYEDVENGVDLLIGAGGKTYNISCYVNTKRSLFFREKKAKRHQQQLNAIEMPLDLSDGRQIGDWILFDNRHVDSLLNKVINFAWKHHQQHPLEILCS